MPREKLTRDDVKEQLKKLQLIYKNSKSLPETDAEGVALINIWHKVFADKTKEQFEAAVDEYIATSPYHEFPVPGEIKNLIKPMSHFTEEELRSFQADEPEERTLTPEEFKQLKKSPIYKQFQNRKKEKVKPIKPMTIEEVEKRIRYVNAELKKNPSEKRTQELMKMLSKLDKEKWEILNG